MVPAAPALPAPKMPRAVPWLRLGYHTEVKAMPMEKPVPHRPKPKLHSAKLQKELACDKATSGKAQKKSKPANTGLPPKRSVRMPAGSRKKPPGGTGAVSYKHLTLPTSELVSISVGAV